jgi:hypothetical protein
MSRTIITDEENDLVKQYLKSGGTITQVAEGEVSEEISFTGGFYTQRKKKKEEKENKEK